MLYMTANKVIKHPRVANQWELVLRGHSMIGE